ncbi:MAG: DegT/DnrJ/EryC1/StrS family aminotransferase [Nanoarchaeota archaeon]|nr:DegT/DnrJ/EryC1/StrS family aminotransferase [Nanoarchaeota archaeon]
MSDFIPQMEPVIDDAEVSAMNSYLSSGAWLTEFKKTEEFEKMICDFTGAKHCVVTNNGTISLSLALLAAGVGAGDEVLVPDMTMIATPNSAKMIGASPVFVDVASDTLCMDLEAAEKAVTPKTKALMYVSFNGRTNDLELVRAFCDKHSIFFIEDAAQSLGSFYKGKHIGRYGSIGSFSFSAPKIITTGQGGALITDDDGLYEKMRKLKDFGRSSGGNDFHDSIGYNFKFTDMQAVIGVEQMKKLGSRVSRKKEMFKRYQDGLAEVKEVSFIATDLENTAPWFIDVYVSRRDELVAFLKEKGFGSRPIYPPIHSQEAYSVSGSFPVTEEFAGKGLWLPSSIKVTDEQIDAISFAIKEFYA